MMSGMSTFRGTNAGVSNPFAWLCTQPEGLLRLNFTPDVEAARLIPTDPFNKKPSSERTESARASRQAAQDKYRSLALVQLGNGHEREKSHFVVMSLQAPPAVCNALNKDESQWSELVQIMQPIALRSDGHLSESIILEPSPTGSSSNRDVIVYVRGIAPDGKINLWLHNESWLKLADVHTHIEQALHQCHGLPQLEPGMVIFLLQRKSLPLSKSIGNQQYRFCVTLPTCHPQPHAVPPESKERWGFIQACTANGIALVCNVTGSDWTSVSAKYSCHDPVTYNPSLVWPNLTSAFPGLGSLSIVPPLPNSSRQPSFDHTPGQGMYGMHVSQPQIMPTTSMLPTSTLDAQFGTRQGSHPPQTLHIHPHNGVFAGGVGSAPLHVRVPDTQHNGLVPVSEAPTTTPHAYASKRSREEDDDASEQAAAYLEHLPAQYTKRTRSPRNADAGSRSQGFNGSASRTATDTSATQLTRDAASILNLGSHLHILEGGRQRRDSRELFLHHQPAAAQFDGFGQGSPGFGQLAHVPQGFLMAGPDRQYVDGDGGHMSDASDN